MRNADYIQGEKYPQQSNHIFSFLIHHLDISLCTYVGDIAESLAALVSDILPVTGFHLV